MQEPHLRLKSDRRLTGIEAVQKGIVFGLDDPPCVQALGQNPRQARLSHANWPFQGNKTRLLEEICHERTNSQPDLLWLSVPRITIAKKIRRYHASVRGWD